MKKFAFLVTAAAMLSGSAAQAADSTLLNVSYDPTRELYKDLGNAFAAQWKADKVTVNTSNGGSGAQARAVIDKTVDRHGSRKAAEVLPNFLYNPRGPGDRGKKLLPSPQAGRAGPVQ